MVGVSHVITPAHSFSMCSLELVHTSIPVTVQIQLYQQAYVNLCRHTSARTSPWASRSPTQTNRLTYKPASHDFRIYIYTAFISPAARSPTCAPIPVVSPAISFLMTAISPSCLKSNGNAFVPMTIPILKGQRSFAPGVHEQIAEQIMDANLPFAHQPPNNATH